MFVRASNISLQAKQTVYKLVLIKNKKIVDFLSNANQLHRDLKLVGDRQYHTAFSSSIQLCDRYGCYICSRSKMLCLLQRILTGRSINNKKNFVRSLGNNFPHHPFYLSEFLHK